MIHVAALPASFDDRGLDTLAQSLGAWPPPERLLLDARSTTWASPYGLAALLTLGQAVAELGLPRPKFAAPDSDDTRGYWARTGFFSYAGEYFELVGKIPRRGSEAASDTLLPLTPIRNTEDVHEVVGKLQEVATRILTSELKLEAKATMGFAMTLSEACQNIVEHAETGGWVAAQTYFWKRRLGRKVAVIAVSDGGIGFRRSLEATEAKKVGERWGDGAALESAVLHSVSRFRDKEKGRGQGIAGIKRYIFRWHGKLSIRSGSARIALLPEWDDDVPLAEHLPFFPGAQLQLTIPAQEAVSR